MALPRILHMITPLKHMSPFDMNMALDAGYDDAIPYSNVTIDDVYGLVQDAIFSRSPDGIKRTGMFIGGKRAIEALDMMDRAKKAMVPPFEISVFADPAGSFTTAAAMVACAKTALKEKFDTGLKATALKPRWLAMTVRNACANWPSSRMRGLRLISATRTAPPRNRRPNLRARPM